MNQQDSAQVSVLMNCYNSKEFLKEALESVYAQTYPHWEIVFYDNASTDGSQEVIRQFQQKYPDGRLRYFRREDNIPLYHARNEAIKHARGVFLAFLDCDDLWHKQKLELQLPLFQKESVAVVFSDTYFFQGDQILRQLYKTRPYYTGHCFDKILSDYYLSLETVMVRMSAIKNLAEKGEIFDSRFQIIGDADLILRLSLEGYELDMVDRPLGKWRMHQNNLSFNTPQKFSDEMELMLKKLGQLQPQLPGRYPKAWALAKKRADVERAKALLSKERSVEARSYLQDYRHDPQILGLWLLSFFPYRLTHWSVMAAKKFYFWYRSLKLLRN